MTPRNKQKWSKCPLGVLGLVFLTVTCWAAPPVSGSARSPDGPAPANVVIEGVAYADSAAARAAWQPVAGSAPVAVEARDGRKVLRFPCRFNGTNVARACWDRKVRLDLSLCRGVQFKVYCRDASPVSYFSLYFQSGDGWYHAPFYPEKADAWNSITVDKADMTLEGAPAGWGQIQGIRLSAWRGQEADTAFDLCDLRPVGVLGLDADIVVVGGDAAARRWPEEARSIRGAVETVTEHMAACGLNWATLSDLEVTAERLRRAQVVVLPYNPSMPEDALDGLIAYLADGGKLLTFYTVPEKLRQAMKLAGGQVIRAPRPEAFAALRFRDGALPGAPTNVARHTVWVSDYTPVPGASRVLADWVDGQGQPAGPAAVLGSGQAIAVTYLISPAREAGPRQMLLALLGGLWPRVWEQSAEASYERIGRVASYPNFMEAMSDLEPRGRTNPVVFRGLQSVIEQRFLTRRLMEWRQYPEAVAQAGVAQQSLLETYCRAQQPASNEFRAFWCHSAFGVEGLSWDEAVGRLADHGFSAVLPNMLWGGVAYFPSTNLPVAPQVAARGDQIARCLEAARRHGLQVHVWKVNWNLGQAAPQAFVERMRQGRRLQADAAGGEKLWLCPSHPDNQALEVAAMVEVARRYEVDGLHFDYIRYPDADHCFCDGCRERFQRAAQVQVKRWPKEVQDGGPWRRPWLDWRRDNINGVVRAVSEQARAVRPKIRLSAAVFRDWASDRNSVGQDWKLWCDRGWLDFVCPMDYTPSCRQFEGDVARQKAWAGRVPCYPGIGASASASRLGADRVIEQIAITRRHQTGGFVIFNYGATESRDLLPLLGLGATARRP